MAMAVAIDSLVLVEPPSAPLAPSKCGFSPLECANAWRDLVAGHLTIIGSSMARECAALSLTPIEGQRPSVRPRDAQILERVLLGESPKALALDLDLSQSTITTCAKRSLAMLGVRTQPSRVPLGLVALVHRAKGRGSADFECRCEQRDRNLVLSFPLICLAKCLPPAVLDVVFLHAQGNSHAAIAVQRRTSERTVANQLALAFQRLRVSGRAQLLGCLLDVGLPRSVLGVPEEQSVQ